VNRFPEPWNASGLTVVNPDTACCLPPKKDADISTIHSLPLLPTKKQPNEIPKTHKASPMYTFALVLPASNTFHWSSLSFPYT